MNATSASRADPSPTTRANRRVPASARVLVWDAPVRVFHWLMVLSFAGAYLTAESERWRLVHVTLGYTMAGLVAFRILWGLVGTRHARFASFVRGPGGGGALPRARCCAAGPSTTPATTRPARWPSSPCWGWRWRSPRRAGPPTTTSAATGSRRCTRRRPTAMLAVVGVHVAGVLLGSWLHRENLVGAMVTGRKPGRPDDAIRSAWRSVAALMLVAVLGFWWLQWQGAPAGVAFTDRPVAAAKRGAARRMMTTDAPDARTIRPMRILLAEDDPLLGDGLRAGLRQLGFQVDWVRDGEAAERELRAEPYAAAVLDLGLPLKDGLDVLAAVRRAGIALPVLVLTARDAVPDRIRGLDVGADDYVVKPVDLHELAARLRALVRRAHGQPQERLTRAGRGARPGGALGARRRACR